MGEDDFLEMAYEDSVSMYDYDDYWINANEANDYWNEGGDFEPDYCSVEQTGDREWYCHTHKRNAEDCEE